MGARMKSQRRGLFRFVVLLVIADLTPAEANAQSAVAIDPIEAAQRAAETRSLSSVVANVPLNASSALDPIHAAQILAAAEKTFPNLSAELENAELFRRAAADPTLRGNLRDESQRRIESIATPTTDGRKFESAMHRRTMRGGASAGGSWKALRSKSTVIGMTICDQCARG